MLFGLFMLITFFANIGALPTDIMESRNIVTAREMVSDGNWLVPTMNGELRLEKPPLPTWIAGGVEILCPGSLAAQRVPAALMGCLWTVFLFLMARRMSRRDDYAAVATVVFLTCYNLILMGRSATWDIYCHAFMMVAIYFLAVALEEKRPAWGRFALAGALMGLSFLCKGPVSFYTLLLPYVVAVLLLDRPSMRGKWGGMVLLIVVMVVVGGWWYAYLLGLHPTEAQEVFHKEAGNWSNHNTRPWHYYWRFFLEMGIWAVLMLAALVAGYWRRHLKMRREYMFCLVWAVGSLVLLSLMPEKKTRYLLPLLAPCALLVATVVVDFREEGTPRDAFCKLLWRGNGRRTALIVAAIPFAGCFFGVRKGAVGWPAEVVVAAVCVMAAVALVYAAQHYRPLLHVAAVAAAFAGIELTMLPIAGDTFGNPQRKSIQLLAENSELQGVPFYHNEKEPLRIELVYALGRKILPLDLSDTLAVTQHLPMVIVTQGTAEEELPANLVQRIETVDYGFFDDNKHPPTDKHYNPAFLNHVTLLRNKSKAYE